jgi:hypothetical protein
MALTDKPQSLRQLSATDRSNERGAEHSNPHIEETGAEHGANDQQSVPAQEGVFTRYA